MFTNNILQYTSVGKELSAQIKIDLYSFKCLFNQHYIVEVEHHKYNILIIKYFQKNHKDSKRRYTLLNGSTIWKKPENPKNFLAILNTITKIMIDSYLADKKTSFGFMGAPTKQENSHLNKVNVNSDGTVSNTKRYNIYSLYVKRYFAPTTFEHIEIPTSSCYIVKSKFNVSLTKDKVEVFFTDYINRYC